MYYSNTRRRCEQKRHYSNEESEYENEESEYENEESEYENVAIVKKGKLKNRRMRYFLN